MVYLFFFSESVKKKFKAGHRSSKLPKELLVLSTSAVEKERERERVSPLEESSGPGRYHHVLSTRPLLFLPKKK